MKYRIWLFAAALALCPVAAFAQTPAPPAAAVIAPAGTTAVQTKPDGTLVFLRPLIDDLEPYVVQGIGLVLLALAGWAAAMLKRKTGIEISQATITAFDKAAETEAGKWFAKADGAAANISIDVHNPIIAMAANKIIAALPAEAAAIGMTPDRMASLIVGKIGHLQATASVAPSTTATTTAEVAALGASVSATSAAISATDAAASAKQATKG